VEDLQAWVGNPPFADDPEAAQAFEDIGISTTILGMITGLLESSNDHAQRIGALEAAPTPGTTSLSRPLGCFAGDVAVWQLIGLGC
jgi:hypothetical protein